MAKKSIQVYVLGAATILTAAVTVHADQGFCDGDLRATFDQSIFYSPRIDFPQTIGAQGNPASGRVNFGLDPNTNAINTSGALFNGTSLLAGPIVGNGKVCATCHLPQADWGLPTDLSAFFAPNDPIFDTSAESGDDPLALQLLQENQLIEVRAGRFNPFLAETDPFRQVFSWRKSQHLLNVVFTFGLLNDGRARNLVEQARGAVFTHTHTGDTRFDDISNAPNLSSQRLKDISSFEETIVSDPALLALLNPNDPMYATLTSDPFFTVSISTPAQKHGRDVFAKACMSCHNMPNVFGNMDHVDGLPLAQPLNYGHVFDIGVAQRNALNLDVRPYESSTDTRGPFIVVPLVKLDGTVVNYTVKDDIGAAADTARYEDLHRFKVPQLRKVALNGPYFHDNSVNTLEDVVEYFNSDDYNESADGRQHPIHLSPKEKADVVAFLKAL
jgi:cytochrome c peroxidase